jgi:hypothetical protein
MIFLCAFFDMVSMLDNHLANSMPMTQVWWLPMVADVKTHQNDKHCGLTTSNWQR